MKSNKMKVKLVSAVIAGFVASGTMALNAHAEGDAAAMGSDEKQYNCEGGNSCKAKGACGNKEHSCAGVNKCRGKGMIFTKDKAECDAAVAAVKKPAKKSAGKKKI